MVQLPLPGARVAGCYSKNKEKGFAVNQLLFTAVQNSVRDL